MKKVNLESVNKFLELEDGTAVSFYLPTHRYPTADHIQEDRIRFKNLLRLGKEKLETFGADEATINGIFNELENAIYGDIEFWRHTTEGLAVFASLSGVYHFHLPIECEEHVIVSDGFDIAPLLAVASYDCTFYLLALAVHHPVLLKGDMYGLERLSIDLPESPEVALNIDELYSNSQTIRGGNNASGNPGVKSHGQGDSRQAGQEERLKFFRIIDEKILSSKEVDSKLPFLLSGTDDEVSNYKEISRIKHLFNPTLSGNHTETPLQEIHGQAWPIVLKEVRNRQVLNEVERASNLLGTGRSSIVPEEITPAAAEGRIDTLIIGVLDETRDSVADGDKLVTKLILSRCYQSCDLSSLVRNVYMQGGKVLAARFSELPRNSLLTAVYRY